MAGWLVLRAEWRLVGTGVELVGWQEEGQGEGSCRKEKDPLQLRGNGHQTC
jgi:hypothetical protein